MKMLLNIVSFIYIILLVKVFAQDGWKPVENVMLSKWAHQIDPATPLNEYPRPQMERDNWLNLNGLWNYAITKSNENNPNAYQGKILVPFPVESALSGVKKAISQNEKLWYNRTFNIPAAWQDKRILLNFDAVDWETHVWINNKYAGNHKGGYDAFSFDITDMLNKHGQQIISVSVWDPTEKGTQPKGKQTTDTRGFWYTAVTGIWQTVWLEAVSCSAFIQSIKIIPDIDKGTVIVSANVAGLQTKHYLKVAAKDGDKTVAEFFGNSIDNIQLPIQNPKLWSPENPFLYDLQIELVRENDVIDKVDSYFGMRKISKMRDENGLLRLALNNEIYFQFGMLDQGWWPGGLYRSPTDDALKYDIEVAKKLGFNMLRKHGKVEPSRWYYWCDKLGILVWQDMTPGDITGEYGTNRSKESAEQFELEYNEMIEQLYNNPSVVAWVIFNEGWGQYDTERLTQWTKQLDPTRLVNSVSGFVDKGSGDISDVHSYPGPSGAPIEKNRAMVLGEFGGLGFAVKGHLWNPEKAWGYVYYKDEEELQSAYTGLLDKLIPYISEGLSAAIYTQVTDVENETNGMMTYDRAVIKMGHNILPEKAQIIRSIEPASVKFKTVLATSQESPRNWNYTFKKPAVNWKDRDFDPKNWEIGQAGFGDKISYNPIVRTEWSAEEIWLRKEFEIEEIRDAELFLKLFHQFEQSMNVYLNGSLIYKKEENFYSYTFEKLDFAFKSLLKPGKNVFAVHCEQNMKQSYFDLGLFYNLK
jgi:beta-galactosidase/beta-glucuronidase